MVDLGPVKTCSGYWPGPDVPCQRMLRDGVCPKQGHPKHGYHQGGPPDDPRWDWVDTGTMSQPDQWMKGGCRHLTPEPVIVRDQVSGDRILVAWYCADCDGQFKPDRFSLEAEPWDQVWEDMPEPNGFERWAYAPAAGLEHRDPYGHLVFTGSGVINKAAPVRPPFLLRLWNRYIRIWNGLKGVAFARGAWPVWLAAGAVLRAVLAGDVSV